MTQKDLLGSWLDFQKKAFDFWQESIDINPQDKVEDKTTNIFEESMKPVQEMIKKWVDSSTDLYSQGIKKFNDAYPQQEIINKLLSGANLYQNLNKFWEDLKLNITGQDSDPNNFYEKWNQDYLKIVSNNFASFLPEQMRKFFDESLDIYTMTTAAGNNFSKPWLEEAPHLQNLLVKSMNGDQAAYIEFNKLWSDKFASSFGKIFDIPQFSMNREQMQKQMKLFNALINFINIINRFVAVLVKVNQETLEKIIKDYQEMIIAGNNPKTFKEFYEYWWPQNEAAYLKLFATPEFSKLLAQVLEAGVNFKKEYDNFLEKQLKFLPYPSKTDMDSVYKTLDTLKREVRALKKEIAVLYEEFAALKETKSKHIAKSGNVNKSAKED
jgi:class III poly(R)-hydroxyalkanoic acid synthase PhaE subunit